MTGEPVRTVFLGSGAFAVPSLQRLAQHGSVALVGVVTAPPRPAGRRYEPNPTPVAVAARELDGPWILTPDRLRRPAAIADVLALRPALAVLADYGQLVPAALLDLPNGALNLHPSLLPRHRGASPIPAAILAGDRETGVTLMRMDAGLDTGPIVAVRRHPLEGTETAPELERTLAALAAELLASSIGPWLAGEMAPHPQSGADATMTRPLRREDGRLDPAQPARQLERQVRAFQPWPGSFIETGSSGRLAILRADVGSDDAPEGTIGPTGLGTAGGSTLLFIEVQAAGGRRMPWDAYVRGRPSIVGDRVVASTPSS